MKKKHLRASIAQAFQFVLSSQRNIRNISQYEFSKRCGFSRQYVSLVESGKRIPTLDFVLDMAHGFDMKVTDFIMLVVDKISYYEKH